MSADFEAIGMLRRPASRALLDRRWANFQIVVGIIVMVQRNEEGGKGWVMCWGSCNKKASRGWNLQARVPGFQFAKSSVELVYSDLSLGYLVFPRAGMAVELKWSRAWARCGAHPWKGARKEVVGRTWGSLWDKHSGNSNPHQAGWPGSLVPNETGMKWELGVYVNQNTKDLHFKLFSYV